MQKLVDLDLLEDKILLEIRNLIVGYEDNYGNNVIVDYEIEKIVSKVVNSFKEK